MLESGHKVFAGEIVELIAENAVYQSYLVNCGATKFAKMVLVCPDPLFSQEQRQAFYAQAKWLSSQSFPYIGTPTMAEDVAGQPACLFPMPAGVALIQTLARPFTARQATELIKRISSCLALPHSAGCWHGNLSPETIYIDGEIPYLADFSLSQLIRLDYNSGIDPCYTSPEQVRGDEVTAGADMYSLGCVYYQLLTGTTPFDGEDSFAIAKQHLESQFPSLPVALALFQPLIDSLTTTIVEERISVDQFVAELTALLACPEIDQIVFLAPIKTSTPADSSADETISRLDEAQDSSELTARIEARLKENIADFTPVNEAEVALDEVKDVTSQLVQVESPKFGGFGRFVIALLLGIAIGLGFYYFLPLTPVVNLVQSEVPLVEEHRLDLDLDQALSLWHDEDFNGAEAKFKQLITIYQDDPRAYNNLASFYAAQGNYEQAREFLEQALETNEQYATVYRNLGSVYAEMARGAYGRALQLGKTKGMISLPVFSSNGVVQVEKLDSLLAGTTASENAVDAGSNTNLGVAVTQIGDISTVKVVPTEATVLKDEQPLVVPVVDKPDVPVVVATPTPTIVEAIESKSVEPSVSVKEIVESPQSNAKKFLLGWAQAWSGQDVEKYLGSYATDFIPAGGIDRMKWEAKRRQRLANPKKITIKLADFEYKQLANDHLQVKLIQSYKSDVYSDQTKKSFTLKPTNSGWKISRERSLGMIR